MATKTVIGKSNTTQRARTPETSKTSRSSKVCMFCETKTDPSYLDSAVLRKFMSDRSKIVGRTRTGLCSKHQRMVTKEIKHARHLSLLPFVTRI